MTTLKHRTHCHCQTCYRYFPHRIIIGTTNKWSGSNSSRNNCSLDSPTYSALLEKQPNKLVSHQHRGAHLGCIQEVKSKNMQPINQLHGYTRHGYRENVGDMPTKRQSINFSIPGSKKKNRQS